MNARLKRSLGGSVVLIAAWLLSPSTCALAQAVQSLKPPQHVGAPTVDHAVTNRAFQGIPSLAIAPQGRFWATWYAGVTPGEDLNNYVVLSTSSDRAVSWTEVLTVDPDAGGSVRSFDPELWVSPDGRLFLFWAQMDKGHADTELGVWCIETQEPDAAQPSWSAPRRIGDGVMMCKPLVLTTGEWVLPISKWRAHSHSAQMIVSTDAGATWNLRGSCNVPTIDRDFDEHMFIERKDGSLWLLVRTKYGIGESISIDRGQTWPDLQPSKILHTTSRFFIRRLSSGGLLLVKHGPIDERTSRSRLTAFISHDDGYSWNGGLMLDQRAGVSYPDGQQTADGLIRIIYDYNRVTDRNILLATFREEDVAAGRPVRDELVLRQLVSQASGGRRQAASSQATINDNRNGKPLRLENPGRLSSGDASAQSLKVGAKLFTDRAYIAAEVPNKLQSMHYLSLAMDGQKTLTCQRAGTVWLLTPAPDRNSDSQSQQLINQGFEKVALPEVRLFLPQSSNNFCTLYQKECAEGETIQVGKWAVPVFLP